MAQAVLPGMRARGHGQLLFVSSVSGAHRPAAPGAYATTKWALEAPAEALAIEAGPLGIQAALLEPGPVSSGALDHVTTYTLPGDPDAHHGRTPLSVAEDVPWRCRRLVMAPALTARCRW